MAKISDYYMSLLEKRGYESIEEMLNDLCLNYEDILDDEDDD